MTRVQLKSGELLFSENADSDYMYYVESGKIEIFVVVNSETQILDTIEERNVFGELGLLLGQKRTANARASGPTKLVGINKAELFKRVQKDPKFATRMVRELASKLKEANQIIKNEIGMRRSLEISAGTRKGDS